MTFLNALSHLPWSLLVGLAVVVWFAICELIALFCRANARRYDREVDRPREDFRDALRHRPYAPGLVKK